MKRDKDTDTKIKEYIETEVKIMRSLNHKHIVNIIDYSDKASFIRTDGKEFSVCYIALELANNGEFFDLVNLTESFNENFARYYFRQLWDGLEHMHANGISHRDLKPENILLDKKNNLKIADFGLATERKISQTKIGSKYYMAPEIYEWEKYNGPYVDLFSLGVILYFLVTKTVPFSKAEK